MRRIQGRSALAMTLEMTLGDPLLRNGVLMKWFRSNIRHGARLALLALSIQFVLSFGHFHAVATESATTESSSQRSQVSIDAAVASVASTHVENASHDEHRSDRDSDRAADFCDICAAVAMTNTAMPAPALPPLQLPDAVDLLDWRADHYVAVVDIGRVLFQPRAPPIL